MLIFKSNVLRLLFHLLSLLRTRWRIEGEGSWYSILSLPDEVLYRVFHHLDCWRILALRSVRIWLVYYLIPNPCVFGLHHQTCRRLYAISKSRLLWQSEALVESYSSGIPLLGEPVENYTSEELEEKIITRAQACQKWRELDPTCFQCRKIPVGYLPGSFYELKWLPGGRWLLINMEGCVSLLDLDAPELTREPLFDASDSRDPLFCLTIWIDPTKYWLSPRMALHCRDTRDHEGKSPDSIQQFDTKKLIQDSSRICVYRLNSTGRGLNMKWSAEEMAIIRTSARGLKRELQLEKEYVLERCMHPNENDYSFKAYLYQYSDGPLRSCKWDWESRSKVSSPLI
jgi:hypothetical protein